MLLVTILNVLLKISILQYLDSLSKMFLPFNIEQILSTAVFQSDILNGNHKLQKMYGRKSLDSQNKRKKSRATIQR